MNPDSPPRMKMDRGFYSEGVRELQPRVVSTLGLAIETRNAEGIGECCAQVSELFQQPTRAARVINQKVQGAIAPLLK